MGSAFAAQIFRDQSILITLISQRTIYLFFLLLSLLYAQPTREEITKALGIFSVFTICIWVYALHDPSILAKDEFTMGLISSNDNGILNGFRTYIEGSFFVLLYLYLQMGDFVKSFSWKKFGTILLLTAFFVLYRNRSMLIGVVLALAYSIFAFRSKNKILLIFVSILAFLLVGFVTYDIWMNLIVKSQQELGDSGYNRWVTLEYFIFNYSPNWFCWILGNGMPSVGNSKFGALMARNMSNGIFASDIGMIGMWSTFGLLPLLVIYRKLLKIVRSKASPMGLKFFALHVFIVPTIFQYGKNPGLFLFVLVLYLYAYTRETVTS